VGVKRGFIFVIFGYFCGGVVGIPVSLDSNSYRSPCALVLINIRTGPVVHRAITFCAEGGLRLPCSKQEPWD
jgi:hypothetical protein